MVGYVAGQPFPLIDRERSRRRDQGHVEQRVPPDSVGRLRSALFRLRHGVHRLNKPFFEIAYGQLGHYAGYDQVGRTEVEPIPIDPDFKKTNRLWLFYLGPELAPEDARGTSLLRYRYADPTHGDDTWTWETGSRRLRRLNEAINSSATGSQTWDPDHYSGFNAKTEQYNYKFLGEKEMLACVRAEHSPEVRCPTDGGASACPERWEMRHMYIVTAEPRRRAVTTPRRCDSKTIVYMDSEMWFEPYIDTYDRSGELFRNHIYWLAYRDRPVPDAKIAIYPFKREFVVGAASTDVQSTRGHDVLPARHRDAGARVLVHQHGRGRQGVVHHRGDGEDVRSRPDAVAWRSDLIARTPAGASTPAGVFFSVELLGDRVIRPRLSQQ